MEDNSDISSREDIDEMEIVYGENSQSPQAKQLVDALAPLQLTGMLYLGYPILSTADNKVEIDALLVCNEHGVVAFDFSTTLSASPTREQIVELETRQTSIYASLFNKLNSYAALRKGRVLQPQINVVTCHPSLRELFQSDEVIACRPPDIPNVLENFPSLDADLLVPLNAAIQRVTTLRPARKREGVKTPDSRGAKIKQIEKNIAKLDKWQNQGAIEFVDGPQRIRGLAGSGKTVVLALKAAYLHSRHPEWKVVVTFQSRTLYQQFRDLIRRFTFEQTEDEPNWQNILILHGWGSSSDVGVYSTICRAYGVQPVNWSTADGKYGTHAFEGICNELLSEIEKQGQKKLFDAVLIDEGQDFPSSFYKCVYNTLGPEKRVIWAYDDLQNLGDYKMPSERELFGVSQTGAPLVRLENREGHPREDIVLPVCYRNTHWALAIAHAVGFGIYREGGLVQMFEEPRTWLRIGYELTSGELELDRDVSFQRSAESYPDYFPRLLNADDAVHWQAFENFSDQYTFLARSIAENINRDELEPSDILIVLPNAWTAKKVGALIMRALSEQEIESHLVGVTTSRDHVFVEGSVAITHIYRAKGNEAPMVYVVDAEYCNSSLLSGKKRNVLFTAITRSRCWVRVYGVGERMRLLGQEIDQTRRRNFVLNFHYPTHEQLRTLAIAHRDMTEEDANFFQKNIKATTELLEAIEQGDLPFESLPDAVRKKLRDVTIRRR